MNDAERAELLARAIDALLHGAGQDQPKQNLDDEELSSLLGVARLRANAGGENRAVSANHQTAVWQKIVQRIEKQLQSARPLAPDHAEGVVEAIAARRPLYEDVAAKAEASEPEVWERVRKRIEGLVKPVGATVVAEPPPFASGDPQLDSLVRAALSQSRHRATPRDSHVQERLWARMRGDTKRTAIHELYALTPEPSIVSRVTPRIVGLAAAVALLVAALGPLPVTGFANHPAVKATRDVVAYLGVTEDAPAPPVNAANVTVTGIEVTAEQARTLLGLPAVEPVGLPDGFDLASSRYYPAAITARAGGVYATVYSGDSGTAAFNIYQEAESDTDLVARHGSPVDTQVIRTPATYFDGGWQSTDGGVGWDMTDSQTLVFQQDGLRTIIHYSGPRIAPQALLDIANAMAAVQAD